MLLVYALRSLRARLRNILPVLLSLAAVTAIAVVLTAVGESLLDALRHAGRDDLGLVLKARADYESESSIDQASFERLKDAPGVRRVDGVARVSAEVHAKVRVRRQDFTLELVEVRGVDPIALVLRPMVRVVGGALPAVGEPGVVIGKLLVGKFPGLEPGGTLRIARHAWPIVGVLEAPGTKLEHEIWADRTALTRELGLPSYCSLVAFEPEGPSGVATVQGFVSGLNDSLPAERKLVAQSERTYYQRLLQRTGFYFYAGRLLTAFVALNLILATANTLYGSFLQRISELAALLAMGFSRRRVAALLVQESLGLAFVGGALGVGLALLVHGRIVHFTLLATSFVVQVSAISVATGLAVALLIGVVGSTLSVLHTLRLDVLEALRDT